jgi:pimeloyl-ACP methyl ester carboxylesterase
MDLHGFGKSSPITGPFSHGEIIAELFAHLRIGRAHVVGLSYGGSIAAEFVQEHAELVRSLALIDSDMSGLPWKSLGPSVGRIFSAGKTDVAAAKKLWFEHEFFDAARRQPAVSARLEAMINDYSGWFFANAGAGLERKPKTRAAEALKDFELPALVVVGELDLPDFQTIADEVVRRLPGARKVVIPEVGHRHSAPVVQIIHPDIFRDVDPAGHTPVEIHPRPLITGKARVPEGWPC